MRYEFTKVRVKQEVEELSVDGGKVRLRTPVGQGCEWKDYKAVNLHGLAVAAYFQDNQALLTWVNQQELSEIVTCLGDGHDGRCESHRWHCYERQPPRNFRLVSSSRKPLQSRRRQGSFGKGRSLFVAGCLLPPLLPNLTGGHILK